MCCSTLWKDLKAEFTLKKFKLSGQSPQKFLTFQWQRQGLETSKWYLVYRYIWAIYHISWWLYTLIILENPNYYMIKLTNLTYILLTFLNIYWTVVVTYYYCKHKTKSPLQSEITLSLKFLWLLQEAAFLSSFMVTGAYWAAVYNPVVPITTGNAVVHICNSVYVLIELMASAVPICILHFYIPLSYLCSYLVFTLIYWASGGTNEYGNHAIYPIMDWENLKVTLPFVISCIILSPVLQGVVWVIHEIRLLIWGKLTSNLFTPTTEDLNTSNNVIVTIPEEENPLDTNVAAV